jgi:phosphoenolpyruvate carboxylase
MFQEEIKQLDLTSIPKSDPYALPHLVRILAGTLGQVISDQEGPDTLSRVEKVRVLCKDLRTQPSPAIVESLHQIFSKLSVDKLNQLTKAFTHYFGLINLAEKLDQIHQTREEVLKDPQAKREGSIPAAVQVLRKQGIPPKKIQGLLDTAHLGKTAPHRQVGPAHDQRGRAARGTPGTHAAYCRGNGGALADR